MHSINLWWNYALWTFHKFLRKSGGRGMLEGSWDPSLTHTQSRLYIEEVTFNKINVKHDCHVIWHFSPKGLFSFRLRNVIAFPCSSIIHVCPHLMFSTSYFKSSLSTISIKKDNVMHLWDFCTRDFEVAILKMIIRTPLFIAMTISPG